MSGIGEYIKSLRESKNYSQRKLGYLSNVSNATINRIENNISFPDPDTLKKLAGPLGTSCARLLEVAGYLNARRILPSNIKIIREKHARTYRQLAEDIKSVTGSEISPEVLENLEKGKYEEYKPLYADIIARYEGVDTEFLFRENTPEELEYAARNFPYRGQEEYGNILAHIKDKGLKRWICDPDNLDYLLFAKKISDLGIDPEFVLTEFVYRIFKKKKADRVEPHPDNSAEK